MTAIDYSTAYAAENIRSFKTKGAAEKWALEWAGWNPNIDDVEIQLGVPFLSSSWNGSETYYLWLVYDVSVTDEGFTITSYRWSADPRLTEGAQQ